ncbi:hypothetical protein D9M69_507060 [compost metagenome]
MSDLLAQARGQLQDALFGGEIRRDGAAAAKCTEFVSGLLAGFDVAGADVYGGARLDVGLGDHLADTTGAAGHQGGAALQGKVGMHGES